jgi:hypothetical protein
MNQMPLFMSLATKSFMKTINPQNSHYCKRIIVIEELAHCENSGSFILLSW